MHGRFPGVPVGCVLTFLAGPAAAAQARPPVLDTVAVVASRTGAADGTRSVQLISHDQIARSSARTVGDVLAQEMGVDVDTRSPAQADVSIRGSSPEQVVVLVDGVRMSDIQSAHYALDLAVPLSSVDRIEILRGNGAALYGPDAVGGVINIVTRQSAPPQLELRGGSFGTLGGSAISSTAFDAASLVSSADFEKSDGHRTGSDYRMGQGRLSLSVPSALGVFRSNLALGVRDFGAADFYAPFNSVERTATTTLDSRWDGTAGPWAWSGVASTRRHQDHYVLIRGDPSVYENRHESWQSGGEVVARRVMGRLSAALGGEAVHDQLSSALLGGRREARVGAFAEGTVIPSSSATVDVGLRGDRSSTYGSFLSPSLSASAYLADWLQVRTSGGVGFRAPTWTERYYVDPSNQGDPNLRPERFWTGDAGLRTTTRGLSFDAAAFERHAANLIDWVRPASAPPTAVWHTMNVGQATYRGVEATLDLPPTGGVVYSMFGTGLRLSAAQGDTLTGKYALRPITQQLGLRATLAKHGAIDVRLDVLNARRAGERGYLTGNARLGYTRGAYRATLDIDNATNADWLDASGKPAASRGVYLGVVWSGP
jgi:vitamin B12 transporter